MLCPFSENSMIMFTLATIVMFLQVHVCNAYRLKEYLVLVSKTLNVQMSGG